MIDKNIIPKNWKIERFFELLEYSQSTNYIVESTDYDDNYKTPVLTAGKSFIIGYTNEIEGIFNSFPVIIFDDFTTATQFVNFPFKVKSSAMKILHPKDEFVNIKFVFYYMQTVHIKSETHKRYWISEYSKLPIPLPPLPEQNQIVAKIEELFSELENGKQRLETIKQQLKTYRQVVLKWAFEGRFTSVGTNRDLSRPNNILNTLPEGWKWVKVSEIGKIETGSTPSKKISTYYSNDFPFYKPTDLEAGYNVRSSSDNLSKLGIKEARFLPENSILVTCIGATIGKSGIIRTAGASNQQINAIIPSEKVNPNFVYYQAIAPLFQKSIKRNASSTTLPILNKTKFMNLEMILCPVKEQTAIVLEIETRLSVCDKMEETINNCLQYTESLRQSILKQAFEGKLVKTI